MSKQTRSQSRIPSGALERLGRIGWMAGELAVGGAVEKARRLAGRAGEAAGEAATSVFLTAANAERLTRRLSRMRGAAMKLGQLLSLEGDDFLPPEFSAALARLRADADAMPDAQLQRILAEEWSPRWRERLRAFDPEPLASASIGQVHAAVAADGRELALKIQYPGVARSIDSDVDNLATALRLSRILPRDVDITALVGEAKRQLRQEADYRAEATNLARYGALLAEETDLVVPRVHEDLTTSRILAMDRLRGMPIEDLRGAEHSQARRDQAGTLLYRLLLRELFEWRFVQSDPNPANYLWLPERGGRIGLVDLGSAWTVPPALSTGYARMIRAAQERDRDALRGLALEIGFFTEAERSDRAEGVVDLLALGCEAFAHDGVYDFGRSDLPARLRDAGLDLAFRRGFLRPPPAETMFLHRKLAGTFLLCARLGARVDVRRLAGPLLESAPAAAA